MVDLSIAPEAAPLATPDLPMNATPEAYGAGLAGAAAQAGHAMVQHAVERKEIDLRNRYEADLTAGQLRVAQLREQMAAQVNAIQTDPNLNVDDYAKRVGVAFDQLAGSVTEGQSSQRIQRQLSGQLGEMRAQYGEAAQNWQSIKRAVLIGQGANALGETLEGQAYQATDPQTVERLQLQWADYAHGLEGLQPEQRTALVAEKIGSMALAFGRGLADRDPEQVKSLMAGGWFANHGIKGEQLASIEHAADTEITRRKYAQKQVQAQAMSQLHEQVATWKVADGQGLELPIDQVRQTAAALRAAGDTSGALELDGMIANSAYAKVWGAMSPLQRQQRMAALSGAKERSADQQRELNWAQGHVGALDSAFNADPVAYAAGHPEAGAVPPQIALDDPASIAARVVWRRSYERTTGRAVPLLSKAEVAPLQDAVRQGVNQRHEVLKSLDAIPADERAIVAEQVMPGDAGFRQEAQLLPGDRATVFNGRAKLKADPTFLRPHSKDASGIAIPGGDTARQLLNIAGSELDTALRAIPQADLAAIKSSAGEWLAGKLAATDRSIYTLSPTDIRDAALAALGGRMERGRQVGGLSHWSDDKVFVLPDSMSALDFVNAVNRDQTFKQQAGAGPSMNLRNAHPVWIGGTQYRWETGLGRIVKDAKGRDYISDVRVR
jgi:hypothetical protein